jgi:hypothetical protein
MAIIVKTSNPAGLLQAIYKAIDNESVVTWEYDSDNDFTHKPEQWYQKAWLRPSIPVNTTGELHFGILISSTNYGQSVTLYGVYHGRFIEMLLNHFDDRFTSAAATALPTSRDSIAQP